jgi:hypothetical protein
MVKILLIEPGASKKNILENNATGQAISPKANKTFRIISTTRIHAPETHNAAINCGFVVDYFVVA